MNTEKLVQEFRQEIEKILMPSTVEHYTKYLRRSFSIFNYSLKDLKNETAVKQLYNRIFARDISNSTRRKYIIAIWKFGDFLLNNKYFQKNFPRKIMELPKTKKILPSALKRGDFGKIYDAIKQQYGHNRELYERNLMIFRTFVGAGLRRTELVNLLRRDVLPDRLIIRNGKGGKERIVYIPLELGSELQEFMKKTEGKSEYLFYIRRSKTGKKPGDALSPDSITHIFRDISQHLDISVFPHLLRHTYASNCIIDNIDIYTLQYQLGHSDISTTSLYLYLNDEERAKQMQKLKIS